MLVHEKKPPGAQPRAATLYNPTQILLLISILYPDSYILNLMSLFPLEDRKAKKV